MSTGCYFLNLPRLVLFHHIVFLVCHVILSNLFTASYTTEVALSFFFSFFSVIVTFSFLVLHD